VDNVAHNLDSKHKKNRNNGLFFINFLLIVVEQQLNIADGDRDRDRDREGGQVIAEHQDVQLEIAAHHLVFVEIQLHIVEMEMEIMVS
jgi:adenylate kinase